MLFNCLEDIWVAKLGCDEWVSEVYFVPHLWDRVILGWGCTSYTGMKYKWNMIFLERTVLVKTLNAEIALLTLTLKTKDYSI